MKRCSNCLQDKNFCDFHINKTSKDGLCSKCKMCVREYSLTYYKINKNNISIKNKKNRDKIKRENLGTIPLDSLSVIKKCVICKTTKTLDMFYKDISRKYGISNRCKKCDKARAVLWAKRNPEKMGIRNEKYRIANPHKHCYIQANRRANKIKRTPKWLSKEQLYEINSFYVEAAKLTKYTGIKHEVDHIIPLLGKIVSGLHVPWNLQILTKTENASKSNTL